MQVAFSDSDVSSQALFEDPRPDSWPKFGSAAGAGLATGPHTCEGPNLSRVLAKKGGRWPEPPAQLHSDVGVHFDTPLLAVGPTPGAAASSSSNGLGAPRRVAVAPLVHVDQRYLIDDGPSGDTRRKLIGLTAGDVRKFAPGTLDQRQEWSHHGTESAEIVIDNVPGDVDYYHNVPPAGLLVFAVSQRAWTEACFAQSVTGVVFTGKIATADVLLVIFSFLPINSKCLLAVSSVSRGWRAASNALPHWCLLPRLTHATDAARRFAACEDRPCSDPYKLSGLPVPRLVDGLDALTRDGVVRVMKERRRLQEAARSTFRVPLASRIFISGRLFTLLQAAAAVAVLAACYGIAYGVGSTAASRRADDGGLSSDASVGAFTFFITLFVAAAFVPLMLKSSRYWASPRTRRQRNIMRRGDNVWITTSLAAVVMTCTIVALASARYGAARGLSSRVWRFTSAGCDAPRQTPPAFIEIQELSTWTIEPKYTTAGSAADGCQAPNASSPLRGVFGRHWWADEYLNSQYVLPGSTTAAFGAGLAPVAELAPWNAANPCVSTVAPSSDAPAGFAYVVIRPPAAWTTASCLGAALALVYDVGAPEFNATVSRWFSSGSDSTAGNRGETTLIRTVFSAPWFEPPHVAFGAAWLYTQLWTTNHVPLVVAPAPVDAPAAIASSWQAVIWVWIATGLGFSLFGALLVALPRSCCRGSGLRFMCMFVAVALMNPLWLLAFGAKCAFNYDGSVCMMNHASAMALFVLGVIGSAALLVIPVLACQVLKSLRGL